MNFFERSKALKEAATKTPWENSRGFVRSPGGGDTYDFKGTTVKTSAEWVAECRDGEGFKNTKGNAEYIVHCVNTHARLCELLEEAMDALDIAYTEHYRFDVKIEIQAVLDEMWKE